MSYFKFRNQSSEDFDIIFRSEDRTILPAKRINRQTIPGKSGTESIFDDTYDDRIITIACSVFPVAGSSLRERARQIAYWLSQKGELEFSDEPGKFYQAEVESAVSIEQIATLGKFTITFICYPFAMSALNQVNAVITQQSQETVITADGTAKMPCIITIKNTGTTDITDLRLILTKGG
ncbi:MAG TPA: hypothetical protein DCP97_01875 [Ruminococcaceae bacterium]|nr:hypothetical protein [Oscillospiraceae bacterium]